MIQLREIYNQDTGERLGLEYRYKPELPSSREYENIDTMWSEWTLAERAEVSEEVFKSFYKKEKS